MSRTPLWFFEVGGLDRTMELFVAMRDAGFFLNVASFPAVPLSHAGLRFTVTTKNPVSQIEDMLACLSEKRLELFGDTEIEVDIDQIAASGERSHFSRPSVPKAK